MGFRQYKDIIKKSIVMIQGLINLGVETNLESKLLAYYKDNGINLNVNTKNNQILTYIVGIAYQLIENPEVDVNYLMDCSLVYIGL